jgi:tetratricopeptide (TPR) repeat protein
MQAEPSVIRRGPLKEIQDMLGPDQKAVIQVSGPWGVGKTFFILQLKEHLRSNGLSTGYYRLEGSSESNHLFLEVISQILTQWLPPSRRDLKEKANLFRQKLLSHWRGLATGVFSDIIGSVSEHLKIKTEPTSKTLANVFKDASKRWSARAKLEELMEQHRPALFTVYLRLLQAVSESSQREERHLIMVDQAEMGPDSFQEFLMGIARNLPNRFFIIFGLNNEVPNGIDFLKRHGPELQALKTRLIEIPGFTFEEIQELIQLIHGPHATRSPLEINEVMNRTGGRPFIIQAWVKSNFSEKTITDGVSSLNEYYLELLRRSPRESQTLARTMSLLPGPLPGRTENYALLTQDKTITTCQTLLDNLVEEGIFTRTGDNYWFRHELIKDFIFNDTTSLSRKELAQGIISLLRQKYPDEIRLGKTIPKALLAYVSLLPYSEDQQECYNVNLALGERYYSVGEYLPALDYFKKCLESSQDLRNTGTTLNNIGLVCHRQGKYPEALNYFQKALGIRREVGDRPGEGSILNNIGLVCHRQGKYPEALDYLQKALGIRREVGDRPEEGTTLNNIGLVYHKQGKYTEALDHFQKVLSIRKEVKDRPGEGCTLNNIGMVYDTQDKHHEALDYYQNALGIHREVGDRSGEGGTFNNIGLVYHKQGLFPKALDYYQKALRISQELGDRPGEGGTLNNIGLIYYRLGKHINALDYYQKALGIRREAGDRPGEGSILNNIGLVHDIQGKHPEALDYYQRALKIFQELGDRPGEAVTLCNIAHIREMERKIGEAVKLMERVIEIDKETHHPALAAHTAYLEELRRRLKE